MGIAVLESWRCVTEAPSHWQASLLMQAAIEFSLKRKVMRFLEHRVLAAAQVESLCQHDVAQLSRGPRLPQHIGRDILAMLSSRRARARITLGFGQPAPGQLGCYADIESVLRQWSSCYNLADANGDLSPVPWTAWPPLAAGMAMGSWVVEVTPVSQRTISEVSAQRMTSPSQGVLKALLGQLVAPAVTVTSVDDVAPVQPVQHLVRDPHRGAVRPYSPAHVVNSLRATKAVASQARAQDNAVANLQFWYPGDFRDRIAALTGGNQEHPMPHRRTLERSRVRFDIACMLEWREWYAENRPAYRYISIDASPQRPGVEILVQVERVILLKDIAGEGMPKVEVRRLPVVVLGHGKCGLADRVQASQHQTWLEYGPTQERVRQANYDTRQVLTDMGIEAAIADYGDATKVIFEDISPLGSDSQEDAVGWLFPLALWVPGPQHIIDGVLKDSVESLPWWAAWSSSAKTLCQWLVSLSHRQWLQLELKRRFPEHLELSDLVNSLNTAPERFAKWRWNTLHRATKSLAKVAKAVRLFLADVESASELGTRDQSVARSVLDTGHDTAFWTRTRGLSHVIQPLQRLSSWLRGCDCHEEQLLQGKAVTCDWKGCRAAGFSARLRVARDEMSAIRAEADLDSDGLDTPKETIQFMTEMLGIFGVKFEWVDEPPYSIWQAGDPGMAAEFLRRHDELVQLGGQPHRVSQHFCASDSPLRAAMIDHAAGKGTSDLLRQELMSYQFCMLDDTWVEAGHRDVSWIQGGRPSGRVPYVAASTRLQQNLRLWDRGNQARMSICFRKYRAMGHLRTTPRRRRKDIVKQTYRLAELAMVDWSARFANVPTHSPLASLVGAPSLKLATRMKVEYLTLVTKDTSALYSLPKVNMQVAESARAAEDLQGALATLDNGSQGAQMLFQVVDSRVRGRKAIRSLGQQQRMARMCCPVTIQEFCVVPSQDCSRVVEGKLVYPMSQPVVVDLLFMAEWSVWRTGLRRWEHSGAAGQPGCLILEGSSLAHETAWNFRDGGSVPTVALIDHLDTCGWRRGHIEQHTLDSEKLMSPPLTRTGPAKPYLQCLACLAGILTDAFQALPAGQPAHFYSCVLAVGHPEKILLGQPLNYYASLLRAAAQANSGGTALEFAAEHHLRECHLVHNQDGVSGEEEPMLGFEEAPCGQPRRGKKNVSAGTIEDVEPACWRQPKRKRASGKARGQAKAGASSDSGSTDHPGVQGDHSAPGRARSSAAPSADAGQDSGAAPPPPPPPLGLRSSKRSRGGKTGRSKRKREMVCILEGQPIFKEVHLEPGQRGHYVRLIAPCMYGESSHRDCQNPENLCEKKRSISENLTRAIGDKEPLAYLGCWLQAAALCKDKAEHMAYKPYAWDIRAYAKEQGWIS